MTRFGYTLMTEQSGPKELVRYAAAAERLGLRLRGLQRPLLRRGSTSRATRRTPGRVLGAVAQATERVELMTYVTCPTMRYHPAVVAQKAATLQLLADGRFTLGLGAGENLNEHVVGEGWPAVDVRQDMLEEAIEIIRELHDGDLVDLPRRATSTSTPRGSGTCPTSGVPIGDRGLGRGSRSSGSPRWPTT